MYKIVTWVYKKLYSFRLSRFSYKFACIVPEVVPENVVFIISEGDIPDTIIFKCPCGCDSTISLNLLPDARPIWDYKVSLKGYISIYPSIRRRVGCKSHFIIREGKTKWIS